MKLKPLDTKFTEKSYRGNMEEILTAFNKLTFEDNFGAEVRSAAIEAGQEVRIPHALKRLPKYRILLRQDDANALITDGAEAWSDKFITLKNQGAADTIVTVLILRG